MKLDDKLREQFSRSQPLPESTERRLSETYDIIRASSERRQRAPKSRKGILLALAAALLALLCACTAVGYAVYHYDFLSAVWRRQDVQELGETLGECILTAGQSGELLGCTVTVEEYMLDDSGMGYVRYSVECPDGLPELYDAHGIYSGGDAEVRFEQPEEGMALLGAALSSGGDTVISHTMIDSENLTPGKVYLTEVFTALGGIGDTLSFAFSARDEQGETVSLCFELPALQTVPCIELSDSAGGVRAQLSCIGLSITGPNYDLYDPRRLELVFPDGSVCLRGDESDYRYAAVSSERECFIFTRALEPQDILCVVIDAMVLTPGLAQAVPPDPSAAPSAARYYEPPADRSVLELPGEEQNPFHYRRADGVEVFCITAQTLAGCSQEDITAYKCCTHGCLSAEELGELCPGYEDNYYFSREFFIEAYPHASNPDALSAAQIIDAYLACIAQQYPDEKVSTVVARCYTYDDGTDVWLVKGDTRSVGEIELCAVTGERIG